MGQFKIILAVFFVILVPLSILTGIYDLEISKYLVNQNSGWANFLENYGMIPGIFIILSGIYINYSHIKLKTNFLSYFKKVIFFLVCSGLTYYLFEIFLDKIVSSNLLTFLIISFAINILLFFILDKAIQIKNVLAIKYSKVVLGMALFGYVIGIQLVKYMWGRVRFRELDVAFSQFTPWYFPQGITGYDSFPSGHAAMGFMLLALLIPIDNKKKLLKSFLFVLILLWGVVLALSRVVVGAHFASDVLFGSAMIIFCYLLFSQQIKDE
jgi:membrane-associated phospholipid phosphatase